MKYSKVEYKICKLLGAEIFQQMVFIVEKIKYYILEKFFPNIEETYFKICDKRRDKKIKIIKKQKNNKNKEIEIKNIIEYYRLEKLKFKKEINKKENRNYHIDLNHPNEIKRYLEYNKKIHIDGLIGNSIYIILIMIINIIYANPFPIIMGVLLTYQIVSFFINFECINLQNYNLCRLEDEKIRQILKKVEEKRNYEFNKNMSKGSKVIGETFRNTLDIPTIDDIINNISSKEEIKELLYFTKKHLDILKEQEKKVKRKEKKL